MNWYYLSYILGKATLLCTQNIWALLKSCIPLHDPEGRGFRSQNRFQIFLILSLLKWFCSIILQLNLYANFAKAVKCIKCLAFLCRRNISNLSKILMIKNWLQQCCSLEFSHSKQILITSLIFDRISKQFLNLWADKNDGRGRKWGGSFYFVFVTRGRKMIGMITTFKWIDGHWPLRTFEQTHW